MQSAYIPIWVWSILRGGLLISTTSVLCSHYMMRQERLEYGLYFVPVCSPICVMLCFSDKGTGQGRLILLVPFHSWNWYCCIVYQCRNNGRRHCTLGNDWSWRLVTYQRDRLQSSMDTIYPSYNRRNCSESDNQWWPCHRYVAILCIRDKSGLTI